MELSVEKNKGLVMSNHHLSTPLQDCPQRQRAIREAVRELPKMPDIYRTFKGTMKKIDAIRYNSMELENAGYLQRWKTNVSMKGRLRGTTYVICLSSRLGWKKPTLENQH